MFGVIWTTPRRRGSGIRSSGVGITTVKEGLEVSQFFDIYRDCKFEGG